MFVAINNKEMNIFEVDKWINTTRDANGGVISPEFAMEILSKTNHFGHIKKVLKNITDNCTTTEELIPYKEFILSCVDGREMGNAVLENLRHLAKLCGCEDELETTNKNPKCYVKTDCNKNIIVKSRKEFKALRGEGLRVFFDNDEVWLLSLDLSKTRCIEFREGAIVYLSCTKSLPKYLGVSQCSRVELRKCDLEGLNLKFRDGAEVDLGGAKNLPKDLDVSMCSKVDLRACYLRGLNLKFREGAEVDLCNAKKLPKDLDFSMCSNVYMRDCDLRRVKKIKFKDKEQEKKFMERANNFNGEVIYEEKKEKEEYEKKEDNSLFSRIRKRFGAGGMGE